MTVLHLNETREPLPAHLKGGVIATPFACRGPGIRAWRRAPCDACNTGAPQGLTAWRINERGRVGNAASLAAVPNSQIPH